MFITSQLKAEVAADAVQYLQYDQDSECMGDTPAVSHSQAYQSQSAQSVCVSRKVTGDQQLKDEQHKHSESARQEGMVG